MSLLRFLKPIDPLASLVNLLVFLASVALLVLHKNLPPQVPLWFSLNWGQMRLAPSSYLWLMPGLILIFFLISQLAAKKIGQGQIVLARILVWSTAFISLTFLLVLYKIILLVT